MGGVYAQLRIIPTCAGGVHETMAACSDPEVVEIRTVNTLLLVRFSPARD